LFLRTFKWRKNKGGDLLEPAGKQAGYAKRAFRSRTTPRLFHPMEGAV
jgi:hypothetical protein